MNGHACIYQSPETFNHVIFNPTCPLVFKYFAYSCKSPTRFRGQSKVTWHCYLLICIKCKPQIMTARTSRLQIYQTTLDYLLWRLYKSFWFSWIHEKIEFPTFSVSLCTFNVGNFSFICSHSLSSLRSSINYMHYNSQ